MIGKIRTWLYWNGSSFFGFFILPLLFIGALIGTVFFIVLFQANTYKYNCHLSHRPDFHTALFIANDTYAYNPDYFCNQLKAEMAKP